MIKYNSTGQFHDVVKQIRTNANYHNLELPVITFTGTVKMHGTNAGVLVDFSSDTPVITCQSRENIIVPEKDNAGFAAFVHGNKDVQEELVKFSKSIWDKVDTKDGDKVQIYGEWIGPGIQKSVGINNLKEKLFVIFKVRVGSTNELTDFIDFSKFDFPNHSRIKNIYSFETFKVDVDFNVPTLSQNIFVELTEKVANDCPVARKLLPEFEGGLLGEGIVWSSEKTGIDQWDKNGQFMFKTKDPRHSVSKIKTVASVDPEKVKGIQEFIEYAVTENRLNQGLDFFRESNIELDVKSTGEFIKWVMKDIIKEELDTMSASGIEPKEVNGEVARKAKLFFFNKVNSA